MIPLYSVLLVWAGRSIIGKTRTQMHFLIQDPKRIFFLDLSTGESVREEPLFVFHTTIKYPLFRGTPSPSTYRWE
jgi:hypothetical protein